MTERVDAGNGLASKNHLRRARAHRLAAILIAFGVLGTVGCDKFRARQLIRAGNANFKEQQYETALKKYEEAQQLDPNEVRLDKFVAMAHMALYNPGSKHEKDLLALNKAIEHFKKYLAANPNDEKAAKYLVTTYMNSQRYDDAIAYFQEWFKAHPNDGQAVQTIAMLYAKKGDFKESLEWQKKRAALEPNNAEIFYTMGVTCWDKSYNTVPAAMDPAERRQIVDFGMQQLMRSVELRPDYFEAMLYINLLYREYAKMEGDEAKKAEYRAKADEWQKKALEARARALKKEREEAAQKNPLEAI